jgi:hypothetical protein
MSPTNLSPNRVPYWRNDLRAELNHVFNDQGHIVLDGHDIGVGLPELEQQKLNAFSCRMRRQVFDDLVRHEKLFGRVSCITEEDRELSGVGLLKDNSWPFCSCCSLPFTSMLQGDVGERGYWVSRIEDGADLCECCWLAEHYGGDHHAMIRHVLERDIGPESAVRWLRIEMRREHWVSFPNRCGYRTDYVGTAVMKLERSAWHSPGLRELIRLHRVSLVECAVVIVQIVKELKKKAEAEEREFKQRRGCGEVGLLSANPQKTQSVRRDERLSA